jgi:hypothetical protein
MSRLASIASITHERSCEIAVCVTYIGGVGPLACQSRQTAHKCLQTFNESVSSLVFRPDSDSLEMVHDSFGGVAQDYLFLSRKILPSVDVENTNSTQFHAVRGSNRSTRIPAHLRIAHHERAVAESRIFFQVADDHHVWIDILMLLFI